MKYVPDPFIPKGRSKYYIKFRHRGKQHLVSLGTTNISIAKKNARVKYEATKENNFETMEAIRLKNENPRLGDLFQRYLEHSKTVYSNSATPRDNVNALARVIREVRSGNVNVENLRADVVSGKLVRAFLWDRQPEGLTPEQREVWKRTANSTVRKARSVFGKNFIWRYENFKLDKKAIESFQGEPLLDESAPDKKPLTKEEVTALDEQAMKAKDSKSALFLAYCLFRYLGMRNREIEFARWNWIEQGANGYEIVIKPRKDFSPKTHEARRLPMSAKLVAMMFEVKKEKNDDDFIVPANSRSARHDLIYREHSGWVAPKMPGRRKTSYELRRYAGSVVLAKAGIYAASRFLGHNNVMTTQKWYVSHMEPLPAIEVMEVQPAGDKI